MDVVIQEILEESKGKKLSARELQQLKLKVTEKHASSKVPSNIALNIAGRQALLAKPVRTKSGVAVIALMTFPFACKHGKCIYCPGGPGSVFGDVPQSYTGREPSTMRAIRNNYDPYLIVFNRLEQYILAGHSPDKAEVIIQGGTFPSFDNGYQTEFIAYTFKALNDFGNFFWTGKEWDLDKFINFFEPGNYKDAERIKRVQEKILALKGTADLEFEKLRNETAKIRCVGLTIETKPDWGMLQHGNKMLEQGCTRVELGVQSVYDNVLRRTNRGHTLADTVKSISELKDLGFKLNFHYMPGLFVSKQEDVDGMKQLFDNPDFRPDMLKIYPTVVIKGTPLYLLWKHGLYKPLTVDDAAEIIAEFKRFVPEYCRIMRVQRDIPTTVIDGGPRMTNLRQLIAEKCIEKGIKCRCIRCREIGLQQAKDWKIKVQEYEASHGREFFIAAETSDDKLLGFCRLRFPSQQLRPEITPATALIRELHVYSKALAVGSRENTAVQHKGIGRQLLAKAEDMARDKGKNKMVVISGVGVREYYRKLGYRLEGPYVAKLL